jgi:hypothetical protein
LRIIVGLLALASLVTGVVVADGGLSPFAGSLSSPDIRT